MQTYVVRVYRVRPEDAGSASGIIEDVESGKKGSFHSIFELQTMLARSIGNDLLGFPNSVTQESNTHDKVATNG